MTGRWARRAARLAAWQRAAALALCLWASLAAHAGRSCEHRAPQIAEIERSMNLAIAGARALDASGARVVIIARSGQDLRRHGLRYSHLGLAYREAPPGGEVPGRWRVVHKLNACGTATAAVYRQGLAEFVLDDLFEHEIGYVVPEPSLQARLLPVLADDTALARMHAPAYNMLAYPWSQRYQQSNQWAIETLAMASEPAAVDRERAQAWLKLQGYRPTTLHIGALTRLGARATAAHIAFDDHPNVKRFGDRIETTTVDSVFEWLQQRQLATAPVVVR